MLPKVAKKKVKKGGGSNELDDLKYRLSLKLLSLKLPTNESEIIVRELGVTDMASFLHKTAVFGFRTTTNAEKIKLIKDNIRTEADANKILSVVIGIREEIEKEKQILNGYLENAFRGDGINHLHNTSYIATIMRTLKLGTIYDLIDVKPQVINDIDDVALPQIYKKKLLALRKSLKEEYKVLKLLMETKFLTLYEAKNVINTLGVSYNSPETFINFSQEDIDEILLSDEKKILLWEWIKSYNISLLKTKLKENFSDDITERIIIEIEEYLKKNIGKDVYGDFHTVFDKKDIPEFLVLLIMKDIKRIDIKHFFILKNIKNRYDLIKLDLNSIQVPITPITRERITGIQASFLKDKEYMLNIIKRAENSTSYSYSPPSSKSSPPSSKSSPSSKKSSSSSSKKSTTIDELLRLIEDM